jgi:hypothetical protein
MDSIDIRQQLCVTKRCLEEIEAIKQIENHQTLELGLNDSLSIETSQSHISREVINNDIVHFDEVSMLDTDSISLSEAYNLCNQAHTAASTAAYNRLLSFAADQTDPSSDEASFVDHPRKKGNIFIDDEALSVLTESKNSHNNDHYINNFSNCDQDKEINTFSDSESEVALPRRIRAKRMNYLIDDTQSTQFDIYPTTFKKTKTIPKKELEKIKCKLY